MRLPFTSAVLLAPVLLFVTLPRSVVGHADEAHPNVLGQWNKLVADAIKDALIQPLPGSRLFAAVHHAQWLAVVSVLSANGLTPDSPGVDKNEALMPALTTAVAAAGKKVIKNLTPTNVAALQTNADALYTSQLSEFSSPPAAAVTAGESAADQVIAGRTGDGAMTTKTVVDSTEDGKWRKTGTAQANAPHWGDVKPFILYSGKQFRLPPPPPALSTNDVYRLAYEEVKSYGFINSTSRTTLQSDLAEFYMPFPGLWLSAIVREVVDNKHLKLVESTRYFMLTAVAMADTLISVYDSKYNPDYYYWRPVTAIRLGNGASAIGTADPTWEPLMPTPSHPEYPSGHTASTAAVMEVLRVLNGGSDEAKFTMTNPNAAAGGHRALHTGITSRSFTSYATLATEVAESRMHIGAHFRFSNDAALNLGRAVGSHIGMTAGPGCGSGAFLWGIQCVPCPLNTYLPAVNPPAKMCMPCPVGEIAPRGASACHPPLAISITSSADSTVGRRPITLTITQTNPSSLMDSPLNASVALKLPSNMRQYTTSRINPPLGKSPSTRRPEVVGNQLVWWQSALPKGQTRIFTVRVSFNAPPTSPLMVPITASTFLYDAKDRTKQYGRADSTINIELKSK